MNYCTYKDCDNKQKYVALGLCSRHYYQRSVGKLGSIKERNFHGLSKTKLYKAWAAMIQRCFNEKDQAYKNYGSRGIKVCKRYRTNFASFSKDIGQKPLGDYSIDRIDNDGNYSCGKCDECFENCWPFNIRWADRVTQNKNARLQKRNVSGHKNVTWNKGKKKWQVRITMNSVCYYVGYFGNIDEAVIARNKFVNEKESHGTS